MPNRKKTSAAQNRTRKKAGRVKSSTARTKKPTQAQSTPAAKTVRTKSQSDSKAAPAADKSTSVKTGQSDSRSTRAKSTPAADSTQPPVVSKSQARPDSVRSDRPADSGRTESFEPSAAGEQSFAASAGSGFKPADSPLESDLNEERFFNNNQTDMKSGKTTARQQPPEDDRFGRWLYTLLIIAVVFFLSAVGFAVITFFRGDIFISVENVQLSVIGDEQVRSGHLLELETEILNRNSVPLEEVELILEYPDGAREPDQPSQTKNRERLALDDIAAGGRVGQEIEFLFFGQDGDEGELKLTLEYSVPRSTARLRSRAEHLIVVSDSPVSLSVRPKTDIHAGQLSEFDLVIRSHEEETIEQLLIKGDYPPGFELLRAEPSAIRSDNEWQLSALEPGESETITLVGEFAGQAGAERTLRFIAGPPDPATDDFLAHFTSTAYTVTLRPPHLTLEIDLPGGRSAELISRAGQSIEGEVKVQNNLAVSLKDVEIKLDFEGAIVEPDSVGFETRRIRGLEGFFDSRTTEAVWSYADLDQLTRMAPGQVFTFPIVFQFHSDYSALRRPPQPSEVITLKATGRQTDEPRLADRIESDRSYQLKLSSEVGVEAKGLYSTGPFSNSGPMPPVVEEPTTYTVVLGLSSSLNEMEEVVVQADVPAYVDWSDQVRPSEADLRYSAEQRRLVWHADRIEVGRGYEVGPREVAFQVEVTPRLPHRGQVINILDNIRVEGVDTFTGQSITAQTETVTTEISEDPSYRAGDGEVE